MPSSWIDSLRARHGMTPDRLAASLSEQLTFLHSCTGPHVLESQTHESVEMCAQLMKLLLERAIATFAQIGPGDAIAKVPSAQHVEPANDGDTHLPTHVAVSSAEIAYGNQGSDAERAHIQFIAVLNSPEEPPGGRCDMELVLPVGAWRGAFLDAGRRYEDLLEEVASLGQIRGIDPDPFSAAPDLTIPRYLQLIERAGDAQGVRLRCEGPDDLWASGVALLGIADFLRQWLGRRSRPAYRLEGLRFLLKAHQNDRRDDDESVVRGRFQRVTDLCRRDPKPRHAS